MIKYSIVIPTYNHCNDLLKPCLESIIKFSPMDQVEVLVVANGCVDNTREYVEGLGAPFKLFWVDEGIGYTKATNIGIAAAIGEYVILLNNDTVILGPNWIDLLEAPFKQQERVGITGPVKFTWPCGGERRECMAFWLVMMRRALFDELGLLDEIFSPGMGEDGDFCVKATMAGYKLISVPNDVSGEFETGIKNFGFPIWHLGNGTFADMIDLKDEMIVRNSAILAERYGSKFDVSIVIPTYNHFEDAFKPCIDAVLAYTDLSNKEIIVVANGCTDGTRAYLEQLAPRVRYVWFDEPIGYVRSVNAGIDAALVRTGGKIVLLDNDSILLPQAVDEWLNILEKPFKEFSDVGATSPFANEYEDMGFVLHSGCTMYDADLLKRLGRFDEAFNPGYFSDSDVAMRIWKAGYRCVEVPVDRAAKAYNNGVFAIQFPVVHTGQVQTMNKHDDRELVKRNRELLYQRHGKKSSNVGKWGYETFQAPTAYDDPLSYSLGAEFLKDCKTIEDWGCGTCFFSTVLDPSISYKGIDGSWSKFTSELHDLVEYRSPSQPDGIFMRHILEHNHDWRAVLENALASFRRKMVLIIFTPWVDETRVLVNNANGVPDIAFAPKDIGAYLEPFDYTLHEVETKTQYGVEHIFYIEREKVNKRYSIVIPTYNHCSDLLKPCIDSIFKYTDMNDVELIVSANGCTDETKEYLASLGDSVKVAWSDEPLGYTKATNAGIKLATGDYVVLLNNDTELLPQNQNQWLNMLVQPFLDNPAVGMSGPLMLHDDYSDADVLIFFCVMVKREVFDKIGVLDEIYTPGGGEDIDFTIRARRAGYEIASIEAKYEPTKSTNVGNVPIWHKDNQTFKNIPEYTNWIVKRNGLLNAKRYNPNIKLNLGSGGISYPGFLSVDLHDKRAQCKMDITKLDFDDNSVSEILASHVFEHLNPYHSIDILKEWNRVLKPGGKLIMEMPDIEKCCKRFVTADMGTRYGIMNVIYGSVNTTGEGGPDNITSPHLFGWWPDALRDHLINSGYVDITFMDEQIPHPMDNFRVEAYKPGGPPRELTVEPARKIDHAALKAEEPGTFIELFEQNSYSVTVNDVKDRVLIDVGANLGMFSLYCVERGLKKSIAVEAQADVFNLGLKRIVAPYPMIKPIHAAVYDEDGKTVLISNEHVGSKVNASYGGDPVQTITLKTLLEQEGLLNSPDLILKLDCEGSEFQILLSTPDEIVQKFHVVFIEIHGNTNENPAYHDVNVVRNRLTSLGFKQASLVPIMWFNEHGQPQHEIGVYVEKWVRGE